MKSSGVVLSLYCLVVACGLGGNIVRGVQRPEVDTDKGVVRGIEEDGIKVFHSIPFAQPPVGDLRFRPPQPAERWQGVRDVTALPHQCPQLKVAGLHIGHEDCLYLHVYVPPNANASQPLPVMFWIFGGGYVIGDAYEFGYYDGKNLARNTGSIIVAINYRLGPLGFLALPSLLNESGTTGNLALQDQRAGLQWVKRNIGAFGGNPSRVTIFGESAGAFSVCWHMVNNESRGLFSAAIMESGNCDAREFFPNMSSAFDFGALYAAKHIGCNTSRLTSTAMNDCLRKAPLGKIMNGILDWFDGRWPGSGSKLEANALLPKFAPILPWGPVVDGTATGLEDVPVRLLESGKAAYVPLIIGSNKNEGTMFVPFSVLIAPGCWPITMEKLPALLAHLFPPSLVQPILEIYPPDEYNSLETLVADVLRDYLFTCSARRAARAVEKNGADVFVYQFVYKGRWLANKILGDYHSSEMQFVWDQPFPSFLHKFNEKDKEMAATFSKFWGNHSHFGSPNGKGGGIWPRYTAKDDEVLLLDVPPQPQIHLDTVACDFWDTYNGNFRYT